MTTCNWYIYIPYFGSRELTHGRVVPWLFPFSHFRKPRPKEYYPAPPVVKLLLLVTHTAIRHLTLTMRFTGAAYSRRTVTTSLKPCSLT